MPETEKDRLYKYWVLDKSGLNGEIVEKNKNLFTELCEDLQMRNKSTCDLTLSFVSGENELFVIRSADNDDKMHFQIDINNVNFELLTQLLFAQISCSIFLQNSSKLIDEKMSVSQYCEMLKKGKTSWDDFLDRVDYTRRDFFSSEEVQDAREIIEAENILWCYNKSCSGKTFLGIHTLESFTGNKFVYNPTVGNTCNINLMKLLLEFGTDCDLLIDDLQCDVESAEKLFEYICNNVNNIQARKLHIFLITWASLASKKEFSRYRKNIKTIETKPERFINAIKEEIKDERLLEICKDKEGNYNLALISTARRLKKDRKLKEGDSRSYIDELFRYFVKTTDNAQLRIIYVLAVLGMYECEAPQSFINIYGALNEESVTTIKIIDNSIFLGHRTICKFIATYIEEHIKNCDSRVNIIKEYISYIDSSQKWKVLLQLKGESDVNDISAVSPIWKIMYECQENLKNCSEIDPTWKNTPSSMYFVILTAKMLGAVEEYKKVIEALCSKFEVKNGEIEIKYESLQTTYDFGQIKQEMSIEDREYDVSCLNYEAGETIDQEKMHRNWLFGLMIGLKEVLITFGYEELIQCIEKKLLELQDDEGYWYPKRVPWVTARILIGLGEAHYTVADEVVSKGIQYLLSMISDDRWKPHTGTWNNAFETSALCLEAFIKCKADYKGAETEKVQSYLRDNSSTWMEPDSELDGVTAASTLIKILGIQNDLMNYINHLAERNIPKEIVENKIDYSKEQSCKISQITYYLIELCWYILEKNLPNVLDRFMDRSEQEMESIRMEKKKIFISYSVDSTRHVNRVGRIAEYLETEGYEVYFYEKAKMGTNLPIFMQKIEECDVILLIGTEKYKEKSSKIKKGGVFYEFCILSTWFMNQNFEKIIPLAFGEFDEVLPAPFNSNKGIQVKRVDQSFLNKLGKALKEKFEEV